MYVIAVHLQHPLKHVLVALLRNLLERPKRLKCTHLARSHETMVRMAQCHRFRLPIRSLLLPKQIPTYFSGTSFQLIAQPRTLVPLPSPHCRSRSQSSNLHPKPSATRRWKMKRLIGEVEEAFRDSRKKRKRATHKNLKLRRPACRRALGTRAAGSPQGVRRWDDAATAENNFLLYWHATGQPKLPIATALYSRRPGRSASFLTTSSYRTPASAPSPTNGQTGPKGRSSQSLRPAWRRSTRGGSPPKQEHQEIRQNNEHRLIISH